MLLFVSADLKYNIIYILFIQLANSYRLAKLGKKYSWQIIGENV